MFSPAGALYLALVHYPVLNRKSEVIASAFTNLDLHDLGRLACTYGLPRCFIVTPLQDQQKLVGKLIGHWVERVGKDMHPDRKAALQLLQVVPQVSDAVAEVRREQGTSPRIWATTARDLEGAISWGDARREIHEEQGSVLLLLGTGWGLAPQLMSEVHRVLKPIAGVNGYNHLSVRCAAAVMLDRLVGRECPTV